MEKKTGLEILVRRDGRCALHETDWLKLVEARLEMIKPHLRDMTLKSLGDIRIINDDFGFHDLNRDKPKVSGEKFNLATRGIFPNNDIWAGTAIEEYDREGGTSATAATYRSWGLTRDGEWIMIEVFSTNKHKRYRYERRAEQVKTVKIEESTLADACVFCKRSPQDIWKRLGEIVKKWAEHRKNLYEDAQCLEEEVLWEEAFIELLPQE